ncbi:unnamed protein product [Adineta steineri]|uniref:Uncharacterized protein n=1 Tax=Adineta steineri TaxID=433720 RepID=A0A819M6R0_9BILA|nr:unnamed protein product [Adineta steineri]CAF1487701.1 unnamed protein product [Adineta steineri]CAF3650385.1 unnamed protein product [Adineta steineri]CAF3974728.1 unnamed protein product [Adineta steineri]
MLSPTPIEVSSTSKINHDSNAQNKQPNNQHESVGQNQSKKRKNHGQTNKDSNSRSQVGLSQSTLFVTLEVSLFFQTRETSVVPSIKEFTSEHLEKLKAAFNKILSERVLSNDDHEDYLSTYHHLGKIILNRRPGNSQEFVIMN